MATTALTVFNTAMAMTDNLTDNADYLARFIYVVNPLIIELYPYSDTAVVTAGTKPIPTLVTATADVVDLDDALALGVLPHGVIAQLFTDDPDIVNFHQALYVEKLNKLKNIPAESEDITIEYGAIGLYEE
jgi:hypothetical protein